MPTVSDLKDQARTYEQQGQIQKALAVYQHILKHLEGKSAVVKVLPLYVKVGDLFLKQNQRTGAVESYERAAEHYAALGSARRVSALCTKILRADARRHDVHVYFTRQLLESGHVGSARDVLADYAESAGLDRALEALDDLAGRPDDEVKPMLERLLDSVGQGERTSAERVAQRVSTQLQRITDDAAGDLIGVSTVELTTGGAEPIEERPDLTPPLIDLGFSTSPIVSAKPAPADERSWPAEQPREADRTAGPEPIAQAPDVSVEASWEGPESHAPVPETRAPHGVAPGLRGPSAAPKRAVREPVAAVARPTRSPMSIGFIGFILGAVSGAGLMWLIAVPRSGADADMRPADSSVTVIVPVPGDTVNLGEVSAGSSGGEMAIGSAGATTDTTHSETLFADNLASPASTGTQPDTAMQDAANPIVVAGLAIESVTEIEYRGQVGYRVVHLLDSGGALTVESFPTEDDATPNRNIGRIVVNVTQPDTVVGVARLERYVVYASAVISEDSLRVLMSRLAERDTSN